MKKIINFLDNHRLILVLLILLIISILFLSINSIIFLNHKFTALECTKDIDKEYCFHNDIKIFKDPNKIKENFFKENKKDIETLKKKYNLPDFNNYTAFYYNLAASIAYNMDKDNEKLLDFFSIYSNTYNLNEFYEKNNLYYDIFYHYKII